MSKYLEMLWSKLYLIIPSYMTYACLTSYSTNKTCFHGNNHVRSLSTISSFHVENVNALFRIK